jgi:hypothetical protein
MTAPKRGGFAPRPGPEHAAAARVGAGGARRAHAAPFDPMGYILVGLGFLLLLGVMAVRFADLGRKERGQSEQPLPGTAMTTNPAADEPTPGRSSGSSPDQASHADRRTPPA